MIVRLPAVAEQTGFFFHCLHEALVMPYHPLLPTALFHSVSVPKDSIKHNFLSVGNIELEK